jgi:thiol-disulfide isomerase/thioredoxin
LELREIAPDLWLPFQVEVNYFFPAVQGVPERAVHSTISLAVEKAVPEPNYPPEHFRAVEVPDELPLFKIDRQGYLENGPLRPAQTKLPDQRELVRVVAAVREQERRFEQFDATLRATYRKHDTNIFDASETVAYENDERTVALPNKLYASQRETSHSAGQGDSAFTRVAAWDGHWTRSLEWRSQPNDPGLKFSGASLRKGGPAGLNAFRPHTALFDDSRERGRPLSEYLTSEWYDRHNRYLQKIEYWGEDVVDGLKCEKLRVCLPHGEQAEPALFFFLWLAKDRNYLPVRTEWYERRWSARLPTGITTVHEWREITGGLWLPVHVVKLVNQMGREGLCEGRFLINWRLDRHVENFSLRPEVTDDLFELSVPGATAVNVEDERGEWIGQIHQAEPGLPTVNDEKWLVMAASARADDQERERRQAALDALIGKPAPEFADATWLNTPALNTKSLAGKVVLLDFWAEWSVSCHQELKKLGEVDTSLAEAGIVVIGVHPTGGRREDIERAAKEFGLDFPIYIDATPSDGKHVWGEFFEQCAVRELPHALVVDQQGRIVAHGRLDAMIAKAQQLLEK